MANITASNVVSGLKSPAMMALGFMAGVSAQKALNKFVLGSDTVQGVLGADTIDNLKQYLSPAIVSCVSVIVGMNTKDDMVRKIAIGSSISGVATIGFKALWGKDLLGSLNGGLLGKLLAEDPEEFEGLEGFETEEEETAALPMGAVSIPLPDPPIRDTNFERETVVNGFYNESGMVL